MGAEENKKKRSFKAALAAYLVHLRLQEDMLKIDPKALDDRHVNLGTNRKWGELPPRSGNCKSSEPHIDPRELKIGIIGAGIAGLYTGLLLDCVGIPYEILEASDRIGGRLYTYEFPHNIGEESNTKDAEMWKNRAHQYYDIGAMRFPKSPIMDRTFDLINRYNLQVGEYIMEEEERYPQPSRYNDRSITGDPSAKDDPFHVSTQNGGNVPPETVKNPDAILDDAFDRFRNKIKRAIDSNSKEDCEAAWKYLMNHDRFSLRDYLLFVEGYDYETVHWLETRGSATNWFDEAFTENVMESLAFDFDKKIAWKYIEGGSRKLSDAVADELVTTNSDKNPIETKKQVLAMSLVPPASSSSSRDRHVSVTVEGEEQPRQYASVINTTTLAALQKMDLTGLGLPYDTKAAIRSLRYDPSTKVAIQFKTGWWMMNEKDVRLGKARYKFDIRGGLGKTDMPIRTCVYPSYNLHDDRFKPNVLLCSYSWGQDSERIAAMVPSPNASGNEAKSLKEQLKRTMLSDLARLHIAGDDPDNKRYEELLAFLHDQFLDIHGYDWSKDPYTCGGAFALFAPGQFSRLYASLVRPAADSRFHIAGEAASAHHAWVVGALDSAFRAVFTMLENFHMHDLQDKLKKEFEIAEEMEDVYLQVAFGKLGLKEKAADMEK